MPQELRFRYFLMEVRDSLYPRKVLFPRRGISAIECAVDSRISRIPNEIRCTAVSKSLEHIVFFRKLFHHPGNNQTVMVNQVENRNGNPELGTSRLS